MTLHMLRKRWLLALVLGSGRILHAQCVDTGGGKEEIVRLVQIGDERSVQRRDASTQGRCGGSNSLLRSALSESPFSFPLQPDREAALQA